MPLLFFGSIIQLGEIQEQQIISFQEQQIISFEAQSVNPILEDITVSGETRYYTQQEIDDLIVNDLNYLSLDCRRGHDEKEMEQVFGLPNDKNYFVAVSCLSINFDQDLNQYYFSRFISPSTINFAQIMNCLQSQSQEFCISKGKQLLKGQIDYSLEVAKSSVRVYQSQSQEKQIIDWFRNFDYSG
jgi:hypothetical protein